jgi:hypothetical protein
MQRLRTLSEAECYARCYGGRDGVKIVSIEPRRPHYPLDITGDDVRAFFEEKLDAREAEIEAARSIEAA